MKSNAAAVEVVAKSCINAGFDAQSAARLHCLTATTGLGISEVVCASLAHYDHAQRLQQTPALRHLTPLIGRLRSSHNGTSSQVKPVIAEYLETKHDAQARPQLRRAGGPVADRC